MFMQLLEKDKEVKKVEMPALFQELNILLAQLAGWSEVHLKDEDVFVCEDGKNLKRFDFLDRNVIVPIAKKYNKVADQISSNEWKSQYTSQSDKPMVVISHSEQVALALALVLEFCIDKK